MSGAGHDSCQWLSVTEETLFLHDGLIRLTDLVELPRDVNNSQEHENEVITFDIKNPTELSERLLTVCGTQNNAYARLLEYRLNALKGFWHAQKQIAIEEQNERDSASQEETIALLKKQGLLRESEQASFATRISVLLVLPLLQSQSKLDLNLCGVTAEVLSNCLRDCAPLSLAKEPSDCLKGLENLLCGWLGENHELGATQNVDDPCQRENVASALVALAVARGHLKTFIHTVHLLQKTVDLKRLPVADILLRLLETEGGPGQPTAILGTKHVLCWGFEELLNHTTEEPADKEKDKGTENEGSRSVTCDGVFLYTTSSTGRGLIKIGTGLHGSLRGCVYLRNPNLVAGKVAFGNGVLLHRPRSYDQETDLANLCQVVDQHTLQPDKTIPAPEDYVQPGPHTTIGFCSDGTFFYWLWCPGVLCEKGIKGLSVFMEVFKYDPEEQRAIPLQSRVVLLKKEEAAGKSLSETLLTRLRPHRGSSSTATLVALTGGEAITVRKEETQSSGGSTSCGIALKTLVKTPIFCDGNTVVFLNTLPGGNNSSTARSLFGSGGSLSGLRTLATNICFNVRDGHYNCRSDLMDAPTCALARGAPVNSLAACYDVQNNCLWTCSNDWVDQYYNPGHQASHHINKRLCIPTPVEPTQLEDNHLPVCDVIKQILQHVGGMCLHQMNSDLLHTPLGKYILQQHPVDLVHLKQVCDILESSILAIDNQIIICALIILQLTFKVSVFRIERPEVKKLVERTSYLVWRLVTSNMKTAEEDCTKKAIRTEACNTICTGLKVLYSDVGDRFELLSQLLRGGGHNDSLDNLRDIILIDFSEQLRNQVTSNEEIKYMRLTDELVHYILKICVKESCQLLKQVHKADKTSLEHLQASIPLASPSLRYMMALQSHLMRDAVLCHVVRENKELSEQQTEMLKGLQIQILSLASKIFEGSCQVLEVLLETCNSIITDYKDDLECRLQCLERAAKATILGHLLPVLLTAATNANLQCLSLADALMPQLVHLVVLTSQAALLLKSQVQAILEDDSNMEPDTDVIDLISESINLNGSQLEGHEEQGFLADLKIPAPWASGKTVESIHPVRDNYKFKESVHIPGARCLYLRFDSRCCSQYDYDKLVVYAGPNTNSKKMTEYGGNTCGFGSRSVLGSGWPKDLVKVEGDTVTFSFEMRSGREHNTPDKAMWGFLITVRAQESTEEVSGGLPFLADLALGLSVLACTQLQLLYQGPEKSSEEIACENLLKSKLLQRCNWQSKSGISFVSMDSPRDIPIHEDVELSLKSQTLPSSPVLPRVRMPSEVVHGLRRISNKNVPTLRPSICEVIKPGMLEERIVSAVVKHLSLTDTVRSLSEMEQEQTKEFHLLRTVMEEVFRRIDSLFRQLQHLGEVEQRWHNEVLDHRKNNAELPPFFHDYHLQETKLKELSTLCYVKGVTLDHADLEDAVKMLREKFDEALSEKENTSQLILSRTKQIVDGLLARLDLLLHVNISPAEGVHLSRCVSQAANIYKHGVMVRSDTDVLHAAPMFGRSLSAPSGVEHIHDDSVIDISRLQRKRQAQRQGPVSMFHDLMEDEVQDRPPHIILLDQLFSFIGSNPEKAISCENFLTSAEIRWKRGNTRKKALVHMKELLTAACRVGGATHLVAAVTSVLQHGPKVEELTCGGMVNEVREAFAETMTSVVQLAARYPIACCNSIGLLCIVPYTRAEEKCLVRSGLVHLLDKLCNLVSYRSDGLNMESQSTQQKVSSMAWAGFQVLANRCVMWETEDGSIVDDLEHSGLARQVSILLTNHLARATECSGNEAAGSEALQEVLSLLNNLSRSRMGKAILRQPACVSKLLSLLLDQRPSPKLVLIILQLCRVALPLMCAMDCEAVELPAWGQHLYSSYWSSAQPISDPPAKIVSLLLAKLGDFLVPGDNFTISSRRTSTDSESSKRGAGGDKEKSDDSDVQAGRLSVFIHKREDQLSHEVIQPLLSSENRPFRLGGGANMERVVRMDREMTKHGKAEVSTDDAMTALRKAAKWAQMGLVVSTGPPIDSTQAESSGDKKKTERDVVCKEKNAELARTDPVRAFISGHVANSMAAEVIALLHSLLSAPESSTAQSWSEAVQHVVKNALSCLPLLQSSLESLNSPRCNVQQMMSMAKLANAALCALGGFKETIKPGCHIKIIGEGVHQSIGQVMSVSEVTGVATVKLDNDPDLFFAPRFSDTVQVPVGRLRPIRSDIFDTHQLPMTESIVMAIQAIILPQEEIVSPLQQGLPLTGDGNSLTNQTTRIVAELQTRACMVLALYLQDINFAKDFIEQCGSAIDMLKSLAKECSTGDRLMTSESQCTKLRMLYRDCAKPPPPPNKVDNRVNKEMVWDTGRSFPPVRSCLFSYSLTGISFLGDPSAGSGLPRGTLVYANLPIPQQAPAFYWELEICSFGDPHDESGAVISFGFAPPAEKKDGAWTNPVGTCLFLNNGKAVHYNGASLLQWRSVRLDVTLCAGDVAGIGWERTGDAPIQGQTPKGQVYFTYNGRRLSSTVEDVSGCMYPIVHIQKKNTRIKANFGARSFSFAEGQQHRDAAEAASDLTREIRESFGCLPFHTISDSDSDGQNTPNASLTGSDNKQINSPPGPPCKTASIPEAKKEYNAESCRQYKLFRSYDSFIHSGPLHHSQPTVPEDESDDENGEEDQLNEDHYALLVKAWEQKVFPIIRRRFRNEAERKDGLEQIRGALQLGMTDIARQTVEFLYEENGGMPRDLHLPTIDDIKEDLAKFTIERVRKGTTVVIRNSPGTRTGGATVLPKYAVRSMLRTFGLTGTVLDIDTGSELVQVESYLRSEGVLVRFWYPIDMLERPPQGLRKSTITGGQILDTSNVHIHRELLKCESVMTRMYCRTALLELIDHCNSSAMEVISCSASLGSGMAASAALLQELDIENLQLLSNELLCPPQPNGTITAATLDTASQQTECLAQHVCSLTDVFYWNGDRLRHELAVAISRAANQGEDYLIELTNQICICLQTSPEMFAYEEFPVSEVKVNTDLHFPGAACIIVSCKMDPKATKKETSLYKSPWARVFSYTGHRVKKTGQATKQEAVSYPRDTSSTSNQNEQYTPAIVPCDRVHLKLGVSPPPGIILTLHALPPQFLLAMAYIETLITEKHGCGIASCGQKLKDDGYGDRTSAFSHADAPHSLWNLDNIIITPPVFTHMIEIVFSYMWRTDIPNLIKEYLFHLIAQSLRILHYSEGGNGSVLPVLQPHLCPSKGILVQLRSELKLLYEDESKDWTTATTASGRGIGIGVTDNGRFSTYFHALMEANLAIAEISTPNKGCSKGAVGGMVLGTGTSSGAVESSTSPASATKRRKSKSKKEKSLIGKKTPRVSESDGSVSGSSSGTSQSLSSASASSLDSSLSSTSTSSGSGFLSSKSSLSVTGVKPEDMLWFHRALTVSQILRCIGFNERHGDGALTDAVMDASQSLLMPTAHQCLLIVTGIPNHLDPVVVKRAITRVCSSNGCGEKSEVFLPYKNENTQFKFENASKQSDSNQPELETTPNISTSSEESNIIQREKPEPKMKPKHEGYAVINVIYKTKLDTVKKALFKSKQMLEGLSVDPNELLDVPEEVLSVSAVSQALIAEEHANKALEHYLTQKLFIDSQFIDFSDEASSALTEVFHSCFIVEQRQVTQDVRQEAGYICLGKDQILQSVADNQLCTFFGNIRPPKKSLAEQVMQVLRKYGITKTANKESSPGIDKNGKGKVTKKLTRPMKEKVVMAVVDKNGGKERRTKGKESPEKPLKDQAAAEYPFKPVKASVREEAKYLTLDGFMQFVVDTAKQDIRSVWKALFSCGFDLYFERCACVDVNQALQMSREWTYEMDCALVKFINKSVKKLAVASSRFHPHEIHIGQSELVNESFTCLQGIPIESIRLRFALLQSLNNTLETFFLPLVDLRPAKTYSRSTAALLSKVRGIIFFDIKVNLMNRVLNATTKRKPDQAAPEISLDPLETIGGEEKNSLMTKYCQAYRQLSKIPSSQLCVRLASGGDPTYSFNVRFSGEEVHGTSGSFRHFQWQIAKELQSPTLGILIPCNNSDFKGRNLLRPGNMTYSEEKLLQFFGQLLGVTIRADIPLGLDLLTPVWKILLAQPLDPVIDLQAADQLTYNYIKKIEMVESESELQALCADVYPRFVYSTMTGEDVELVRRGRHILICWENWQEYVDAICALRLKELSCAERIKSVWCGLATVIPLQLLTLMTPLDLELRTCGLPEVDIDFLKVHTMYQVGLMENDKHIEYFWNALETFSQEDLCKFIKFSCNQERIPQTCPCREGSLDSTHVPPYPMKIAPPDGAGSPDSRYIRAETCMFMIKLPQYSSQEIMTQKLLYAINCREDPLSG